MMNSPNTCAVFVVQGMILLAGEGFINLGIGLGAVPLLAVTLVRESWMQFVIGMAVLLIQAPAKRKLTLVIGMVVAGIGISSLVSSHMLPSFIQVQIDNRLNSFSDLGQDTSAGDRLDVYRTSYQRIVESPLGEGFDTTAGTATASVKKNLPPIDSEILQAAITFGVMAGTAYFVGLVGLFVAAHQACRRTGRQTAAMFAVLSAAYLTLPIGVNQSGEESMLMWAALGLIFATDQLERDRARLLRYMNVVAARKAAPR